MSNTASNSEPNPAQQVWVPHVSLLRHGNATPTPRSLPPDQPQRDQALDPTRSILVQAPAGSGKTTLLTQRFLTLLAEVDEPGQVVAITFTIAAAAEMRNRILDELRAPEPTPLARRVLDQSTARNWQLLDLPSQLRISTIDSFCRDLALQQPLLSGLGGSLAIAEQPQDLYRRAARHTLSQIGSSVQTELSRSIEALLQWRDNNWQEMEDLLVGMLDKRDRWMHGFVLGKDPDWEALRARLERPFANAIHAALTEVSNLLDQVPHARLEAQLLARFACSNPSGEQHRPLAELAEFPLPPFPTPEALEEAHQALSCLASLVLTLSHTFRKAIDKNLGFPADRKPEKARMLKLVADLAAVPGLESALAAVRALPPLRYTDDDWAILRACFTLLRHAAAQLKVVFAEASAVDFTEVAQIAQAVLRGEDSYPTDAAIALADGIHHLLVDEFQDTSRRQHQLLSSLIAAWPDRSNRTLFAVGDPMQSIYFFREADAELFTRVKEIGLEIPNSDPLLLDFVPLSANFRTTPALVEQLNVVFDKVFASDDGSGVAFSVAIPARESPEDVRSNMKLHISFTEQTTRYKPINQQKEGMPGPQSEQVDELVSLIRSHQPAMEAARATGQKHRIAVLARARKSLAPIAEALRKAAIPFRAVDLERLADRPEVLDALCLARALLNPHDRVSWLGVLRAPWCGLSLADLHTLTSADDPILLARPIPGLLAERLSQLTPEGRTAANRVLDAIESAPALQSGRLTASLGTNLRQVWLTLGGPDCCDATARANLDLLWSCLDRLPAGEPDLLSPILSAALDKLTALPDPAADPNCGIQLMTIHKSKGLEFEVVIVPDLQARTAGASRKLLSWLERGLPPHADSEASANGNSEITEFLIAPIPTKGEDPGSSKSWVDSAYRARESQETRRILYVAATRAREELHLFARPACKVEANGDLSLPDPSTGLLSTAWPALEEEIRAQFETWKLQRQAAAPPSQPTSEEEIDLAASAEPNLFLMPSAVPPAVKPTLLRRLPPNYTPPQPLRAPSIPRPSAEWVGTHDPQPDLLAQPEIWVPQVSLLRPGKAHPYTRHEGGLISRALGTAVHTLLEDLARLRVTSDWPTSRTSLAGFTPRIAAQIRASGIPTAQAAQLASEALKLTIEASHAPAAQWILSPHPEAASELSWTGTVSGTLTTVRVDRIFRAGLTPQSEGRQAWWIVDYKTAHAESAPLTQLRPRFAPQLEAYARILRNLHGEDALIRAGLYYPRMQSLDWWEI